MNQNLSKMQNSEEIQPLKKDKELPEFARHVHGYIRDYINLADQKAAFIVTIGTALLALLNQIGLTKVWSQKVDSLVDILAITSLISIGVSVFLAIVVVTPNLNPGSGHRGYIFWESIKKYNSSERYLEAVESTSSEELTRALLEHCYALANVCQRKYKFLKISILVGALGALIALILLVFT